MNEYLILEHMEEVVSNRTPHHKCYYIPHHPIYRPEKSTTQLRVVFDASAKTTTGYYLNSILLNGGNIHQDLFSIIARFCHCYAFSADIQKMYRQLIDLSQTDLQRILWKEHIDAPIKIYRLRTVTYGLSRSLFLATRTLKALAEDEKMDFPDAATVYAMMYTWTIFCLEVKHYRKQEICRHN